MSFKLHSVVFVLVIMTSCQYENLDNTEILSQELELKLQSVAGSLEHYILPNSTDLSSIPQDDNNKLNVDKVKLGQFLFYETGMGVNASQNVGMETFSCASCHDYQAAYKPASRQGIADGGFGYGVRGEMRTKNPSYRNDEVDAQGARPLSVLNVAFVTNTFWNGQFGAHGVNEGTEHLWNEEDGTYVNEYDFESIEAQNHEGLRSHRMEMTEDLARDLGYIELFDRAFPDLPKAERYTSSATALALSAYLRTLLTNKAPFQDWLKGDHTAMSDETLKGALLFFGKARCFVCHKEPNLGSIEFHAMGVKDMYQMDGLNTGPDDKRNLGRGGFTGKEEDMFAFKVPQLYNMKDNAFYFHGGSIEGIENLIEYKNRAQSENANVSQDRLSNMFRPLILSSQEKKQLIAFLSEGLHDSDLIRYVPNFIMSGNCFPNNDARSKNEIGCD